MSNSDRPINASEFTFENQLGHTIHEMNTGLTKREYFAVLAMQGLLGQSNGSAMSSDCELGAKYCVQMADALLKELENTNKE
jgi:hypothetical protein